MKKMWLIGFVLATVVVGLTYSIKTHANKTVTPPETTRVMQSPTATNASLLAAVNAERAKYGAPLLTEDHRLDASAQAKCDDETANNYFDHVSPTGVRGDTLVEKALDNAIGYYDENLVQRYPPTVDSVMAAWIASPAHHTAMVDPHYTITGFGVSGENVCEHFFGASN